MKAHPFVTQARAFIQTEALFLKGDVVLVGVSGGADSVAMLLLLIELRHLLGIDLVVAHYDHALRVTSARDALFVKKLTERLGIPCIIKKRKGKYPKASVEEYARGIRQAFFLETAQRINADALALAHTKNDLAETVFMRILRGTGIDGLRAILPKRKLYGLNVVRPLLSLTRKDVEVFLGARKQRFVTDPTNKSDDFLRNVVRRKIFPFIERATGLDVKTPLVRLAHTSVVDYDFLESASEHLYQQRMINGKKTGLTTKNWSNLHLSVRRNLIRFMALRARNDFKPPSLAHVEAIDRMILAGKAFSYELPQGFMVSYKKDQLFFTKTS